MGERAALLALIAGLIGNTDVEHPVLLSPCAGPA